jgi:hypothetical protein
LDIDIHFLIPLSRTPLASIPRPSGTGALLRSPRSNTALVHIPQGFGIGSS